MRKTRCILIDDEPIAIRILTRHLELFNDIDIVATFNTATAAINYMRDNSVDLVFSDIDMPQMNGLEFLRVVKNPPRFIYTTAYREYAADAFDLDVVDYLVKPISIERLGRALERYYERCKPVANSGVNNTEQYKVLNLKSDKKIVRVDTDSITHIESMGDYIVCHYNNKKVVSRERISGIFQLLPEDKFIRIHRQYIVAIDKIESVVGNMVTVNGLSLPVSRSYRSDLKKSMGV
jgi:DNA-binding LytR/AlgR family response regulator